MTYFRLSFVATLPLALASLTLSPLAAQDASDGEVQTIVNPDETKGEMRLSKLLDGRVAGEPQTCIRTRPNGRMQTIDNTAYVYGSGNTIYVQRTQSPDRIDDTDALIINRFNATQLCRLDIVTTIDPFTGIFTGVVYFEDFVPYTRVKADRPSEG